MRQVQHALAQEIPSDLPGPVVFIGLAETAIALGQGVHACYVRRSRRSDTLFLHTTRYRMDRPPVLRFLEEHSHAALHLLHQPAKPIHQELLREARSLVMIDDEASTGMTFRNLARAFVDLHPEVVHLVCGVITDWSGGHCHAELSLQMPGTSVRMISLLQGGYRFSPRSPVSVAPGPVEGEVVRPGHLRSRRDYGRLGGSADRMYIQGVAAQIAPCPGERILVLGTGEFVYPPFLVAECLEQLGADVFVQATTRSPVSVGHGIGSALQFVDNYGEDIPNFVYNVRCADYDRIFVCHETPEGSVDPSLLDELNAVPIAF